jgi:hypothetical protein
MGGLDAISGAVGGISPQFRRGPIVMAGQETARQVRTRRCRYAPGPGIIIWKRLQIIPRKTAIKRWPGGRVLARAYGDNRVATKLRTC